MVSEVPPGESNRVRRLFRDEFTFQISIDTARVRQGLAVRKQRLRPA